MIFSPANVHLIAAGKKRQTRRPVKADQPCRVKEGRSYAVQPGRGRPAALRVIVAAVRLELLGLIGFDDARAEGFRTVADFQAGWVGIHDKAWLEREGDDADLSERFESRHADRLVWVISFELSREDRPRFLGTSSPLVAAGKARVLSPKTRKPGRAKLPERALTEDQALGYVESAARGMSREPEPVTGTDLDRLARKGAMTAAQWRMLEVTAAEADGLVRSVEERVGAAVRAARRDGVDVSREVWMVRKFVRDGRSWGQVEGRLRVLELKAFTTRIEAA